MSDTTPRGGLSRRALFSLAARRQQAPGDIVEHAEALLQTALPAAAGVVFACRSAGAIAPPGWVLVELPTLALVTPGWILQVRLRGGEVRLAPCEQECCTGTREVEALAARLAGSGKTIARAEGPIRLREPFATADGALRLADPDAADVIEDAHLPLGLLELDAARCTLCGACAAACPANALEFRQNGERSTLRHDPAGCVGCDRCVLVCPEGALAVRRGVDLERLRRGSFVLVSCEQERCRACGAELPPREMRRRVNELLGRRDAPLELCSACWLNGRTPR